MMEPVNEIEECGNCLFWNPHNKDAVRGECRRHAPRARIDLDDSEIGTTTWPETRPDDWCGEFKGRG